jgi:intracellular multiplication protein IcmO
MADQTTQDVRDLKIESRMMTRHCLGIAATGGGKSNFLNLILKQQMMRGGGAIHIDGKNSKEAIIEFLSLAKQHNRWQDVRIINIGDATFSNTYNPLLRGDNDEVTSRIMQLLPEQGGSGAFFRSQAGRGMRAIAGILKALDKPYNFGDLNVLMSNETAMRYLLKMAPQHMKETKDFKIFMDQMMEVDARTGAKRLSTSKLQHTFGDLAGRLHSYYVGNAGKVLNSYNPDVDLYTAIRENLLIYVALPMLSKSEIAVDFAKFFISDLRTAIGQIQNDDYKPAPTYLVLMDEFSSYAMPSLAPVFEQARSSNICLFPFIQTYSSLTDTGRGLGKDFAAKIFGNTWNKISFLLQEPESCEIMSTIAGETLKESISESFSENLSFQAGDDDASALRTGSRGRGFGKSISYKFDAIVRPEEFKNLADGEAIYIGRSEVLKLQVPLVHLNRDDKEIDMPRFRMPHRQGLGLAEMYHALGGGG